MGDGNTLDTGDAVSFKLGTNVDKLLSKRPLVEELGLDGATVDARSTEMVHLTSNGDEDGLRTSTRM